jgi:hypothetical protein
MWEKGSRSVFLARGTTGMPKEDRPPFTWKNSVFAVEHTLTKPESRSLAVTNP